MKKQNSHYIVFLTLVLFMLAPYGVQSQNGAQSQTESNQPAVNEAENQADGPIVEKLLERANGTTQEIALAYPEAFNTSSMHDKEVLKQTLSATLPEGPEEEMVYADVSPLITTQTSLLEVFSQSPFAENRRYELALYSERENSDLRFEMIDTHENPAMQFDQEDIYAFQTQNHFAFASIPLSENMLPEIIESALSVPFRALNMKNMFGR